LKAILGIGNPGVKYEQTWHNFGFWVVDGLAKKHRVRFESQGPLALIANFELFSELVYLVKPKTFVNLSGQAARWVTEQHHISGENLLVVSDDADLSLGQLRLRAKGTSAGHRGLDSIFEQLGSEKIPRLRLGIGRRGLSKDLVDHVLDHPRSSEGAQISEVVERAMQACEDWIQEGIEKAMNQHNQT
jgi:peptidyl-tRNA hydrolase, PTH1 family